MSNNGKMFNSGNAAADAIADSVQFAPGAVYESKFEFYRDMRNPRYKTDPVFQAKADEKAERSFAGREMPNVHVVSPDGDHLSVSLRKDPKPDPAAEPSLDGITVTNLNGVLRVSKRTK